jgi:hypothetical protein
MSVCEKCGKTLSAGEWPFCGGRNNHGYPLAGISIIDDQLEGGPRRFETMGDDEPFISTKSEWRRQVAARNLEHVDRHDRDYYRRRFRRHEEELKDTGRSREY